MESIESIDDLLSERDKLEARRIKKENALLRESLDVWDTLINPLDSIRDENGEWWNIVGGVGGNRGGTGMNGQPATDRAGFPDEVSLSRAREICRVLSEVSEFAINIIENRISYVVGQGMKATVVAKQGRNVDKSSIQEVQNFLDEWVFENKWHNRQQEIVRRRDRDGETFLRFFRCEDGMLRVRFVEPWQVANPAGVAVDSSTMFGIQTKADDVESVLGYWVDNQFVDASEIQHRKANVDSNVRRGVMTLWPVRNRLVRADKILNNISAKIELIAAFALIRKHRNSTTAGIERFRDNAATGLRVSPSTGLPAPYQKYKAGTILDATGNIDYEVPGSPSGVIADSVAGLDAVLRSIAARLTMPEFMVTSNAANANYSSTLVAEGPAVKSFERLQADQIADDQEVIWMALKYAAECGKFSPELLESIEVQMQPPQITVRNKKEEADVAEIEKRNGVLSPQTWAQRAGLDYEQEQKNIQEHRKSSGTEPATPGLPTLPVVVSENPSPPTQPGESAVQDTALNGAQIDSLLKVTDQVRLGQLSKPAATEILRAAFPLMAQDRVLNIVNAIEVKPQAELPPVVPTPMTAKEHFEAGRILLWKGLYP